VPPLLSWILILVNHLEAETYFACANQQSRIHGSPVLPVMLQCTPTASARHIPGPRNTPKLIPSNLSAAAAAAAAVHKP